MKVLLNAFDSATTRGGPFPNLAIMKLSAYHKNRGDEVGLIGKGLKKQDNMSDPDMVYISCIFSENGTQARGTSFMYPSSEFYIGGSGVNLVTKLDYEIEYITPDYDIYNDRGIIGWPYAVGFSSRGCNRHCKFCIVGRKEGDLEQATPLEDLVNDSNRLLLLDNNLTMDPLVITKLKWLRDWGGKVNFIQGLDARIIVKNPEIAERLIEVDFNTRKFDYRMVNFAYDSPSYRDIIEDCVGILDRVGFHLKNEVQFYVLVNYNTTFEEDLSRALHLKELGTNPFIMVYNKKKAFWSMDYREFCEAGI